MAITVQAAAQSVGNVSSVTVTKPVAAVTGDLMVIAAAWQGNGGFTSAPADWLAIDGIVNPLRTGTSSSDVQMRMYQCRIVSGSPASWVFNMGTSKQTCLGYVLVRGTESPTPISASSSATNTRTAPTITTTDNDSLLVYICGGWKTSSGITYTPPTGMTERVDGGVNVCLTMDTEPIAVAAATGTRTATPSDATAKFVTAMFAIAPQGVAGNVRTWTGTAWTAVQPEKVWSGTAWI